MFKKAKSVFFSLLSLSILAAGLAAPRAKAVTIREFTGTGGGFKITKGSDGNLWFTQGGVVGRLTPTGDYTNFDLPGTFVEVGDITEGPDGAFWMTAFEHALIVRMTKGGVFTEFPLPTESARPTAITVGPDGNLWFTTQTGRVGHMTPTGEVVEVSFSEPHNASDIIAGPDGNLWFSDQGRSQIVRLTPQGGLTAFSLPTWVAGPTIITAGLDGNVWYARSTRIGKVTPRGEVTEFSLSPNAVPEGMVGGPDGNVWYTDAARRSIGRITAEGVVTEFDLPAGLWAGDIAVGPDGNFWMTASSPSEFLRFSPGGTPGPCVPSDTVLCIDDQPGDRRFKIEAEFSTTQAGGLSGAGHAVALANVGVDRGGLFWFFSQDNPEVFVKVLHGCEVNQKHWVFLSAGTNVGYIITVTDTATNVVRSYYNVDLQPAPVVQDTAAFSCAASP